jgi:hypothetical protein
MSRVGAYIVTAGGRGRGKILEGIEYQTCANVIVKMGSPPVPWQV